MTIFFYAPNAFEPWDHRNPDDPGIGGSETAVVELSRRLARRGHAVAVYGKLREDTTDDGRVRWRPAEGADTTQPGLWVICRSPKSIDLFEPAAGQTLWHQNQDIHYSEATGGGDITEARAAKLDRLLALCPTHAQWLRDTYPFLGEKITLSSNGVKSDAMAELRPLARDPFRLIWASSPDRGLETTLKVFNRAREFEPRLSLHICYGYDNIDKLIAQHGENGPWAREKRKIMALSGPGVVWRGRLGQRELWREYLQSGLWVYCTAFTETSCISCMEAQALGAIPICTPVWALRHNVKYGVSIQGSNTEALTQARFVAAILRLVRDPELAESIRRPMMHWARFRFDWEAVVDQYEAMMPADLAREAA
jgi:glycosyltransferase involved in cell wall biosynthesis